MSLETNNNTDREIKSKGHVLKGQIIMYLKLLHEHVHVIKLHATTHTI